MPEEEKLDTTVLQDVLCGLDALLAEKLDAMGSAASQRHEALLQKFEELKTALANHRI